MESKIDCAFVSRVMKKLGFSYFICVPPIGRREGLVFCCHPGHRFKVLCQSNNIFHLEVSLGGETPNFLCSLVYGPSVWREKEGF